MVLMIFGSLTNHLPGGILLPELCGINIKRSCGNHVKMSLPGNWQTGMTKDHVVYDREGSSPFSRTKTLILSDEF